MYNVRYGRFVLLFLKDVPYICQKLLVSILKKFFLVHP